MLVRKRAADHDQRLSCLPLRGGGLGWGWRRLSPQNLPGHETTMTSEALADLGHIHGQRQTELGQSPDQVTKGQAHNAGVTSLYPLHGTEVLVLDGVAPSLVQGIATGYVASYLLVGVGPHPDRALGQLRDAPPLSPPVGGMKGGASGGDERGAQWGG